MFVTTPGVIRVIENNRQEPARPVGAGRLAIMRQRVTGAGRAIVASARREVSGDRKLVKPTA